MPYNWQHSVYLGGNAAYHSLQTNGENNNPDTFQILCAGQDETWGPLTMTFQIFGKARVEINSRVKRVHHEHTNTKADQALRLLSCLVVIVIISLLSALILGHSGPVVFVQKKTQPAVLSYISVIP